MEQENLILKERERIKGLIYNKIEAVNIICGEKRTKRGKRSIAKSKVLDMFGHLIFLIDHSEYISKNKITTTKE
jgi:hypothetical protein